MLIDPDEANDWTAEFDVDLARSRAEGVPVLHFRRLGLVTDTAESTV